MDAASELPVIKLVNGHVEEVVDFIAVELAFALVVNGREIVSLMCTPTDMEAMAIGFLLSEGVIVGRDSLESVTVDEKRYWVSVKLKNLPSDWSERLNKKTITSGCGQGVTFTQAADLRGYGERRDSLCVTLTQVKQLFKQFGPLSGLFDKTGGVHSAALASPEEILLFCEDVGRHNAVDKLIGKAFLAGISVQDKILLSSGRISGEIMTKVIRNRISILITRSAPTCMSISYGEDYGVTLIGFARGNRMNVYTHPRRVNFSGA
nr:formate dehydrogenase accessory sulfurtransferase FdhD [Desulfobulbaceae bacterium]